MGFKLDRRTMLKGLGIGLGLPLLEAMVDSAPAFGQTVTIPKRYIVVFCGQSMGADGDSMVDDYVPNTVGANYDLKTALAPLGTYGVQNQVSVISGLKIPTASSNGGVVPAGGRPDNFHVTSLSPLLSGVRSDGNTVSKGPTSDQIVAQAIAGNTPFQSLVYRVQAEWYLSVSAPYGRDMISYNLDSSGNPNPIPATVSPQQAFQDLFSNFTGGLTPAQIAQQQFQLKTRKSVLDLVRTNAQALLGKVGHADQVRLQNHYDAIRDLENRISALPPPIVGACQKPADPGADPALGGAQGTDGSGNNTYSTNLGYSGEDQRGPVLCDLIHMAMACDLTRVASLQLTMFQSHMNMYPITGQPFDLHEIGHSSGSTVEVAKGTAWNVKQFAYLVSKFANTPEGSGTMLDNTAMVFIQEGGHGLDPSSGEVWSSHSTDNMAALVAGNVGGLHAGLHIPAPGAHPASVLLTAMNAVGLNAGSLGEVSGEIPGLRG
jgi:hypothetical protein